MSHTRKTPPIKYTTANLPTDVDAGTMALDTTTNEQKVFNGTAWEVVEGEFIGTPTIVFDSTGPSYDQIQGDIPDNWKNSDTSLKGLVIGTSCTRIGDWAFQLCNLTGSLVIPNSLTYFGTGCFRGCTGLIGSLIIPDSVVTIQGDAFNGTSFTSVTIPNSVTSIGGFVFGACYSLTNINCYVEKSVLDYNSNLIGSAVTTIHVRSTDTTWTAGTGQTIGGKSGITVIKDL